MKKKHMLSNEEKGFIRDNAPGRTNDELITLFERRFNISLTLEQMARYKNRIGVTKKKRIALTKEKASKAEHTQPQDEQKHTAMPIKQRRRDTSNIDEEGCLRLAGAVIRLAIEDLVLINSGRAEVAKAGRDALKFLSGKGLEDWCSVLNMDPSYIRRKIEETCGSLKKGAGENGKAAV